MSCVVSTDLYGAFDCMFLLGHVRTWEWIHTIQLPECEGTPCSKQAPYLKSKWLQRDSNPQSLSTTIWLNGWVFVYGLSDCGFESCCSHLIFRNGACFEKLVPWHSGNCRVWIHSQTRTWHDNNIQSNAPYR